MDKWAKLSIYDVDFKITDEDGEEHNFTFKPLPWENFPQAFDTIAKIETMGLFSQKDNMTEEEAAKEFLKAVNKEVLTDLSSICKIMVRNSYPEIDEKVINSFVMGNLFQLVEPLSKVLSRQSKDKRKANKALKSE